MAAWSLKQAMTWGGNGLARYSSPGSSVAAVIGTAVAALPEWGSNCRSPNVPGASSRPAARAAISSPVADVDATRNFMSEWPPNEREGWGGGSGHGGEACIINPDARSVHIPPPISPPFFLGGGLSSLSFIPSSDHHTRVCSAARTNANVVAKPPYGDCPCRWQLRCSHILFQRIKFLFYCHYLLLCFARRQHKG